VNRALDGYSMRSMRQWCVFNIDSQVMFRTGHNAAPPAALSAALQTLLKPVAPATGKIDSCRADVEKQLTSKFDSVERLLESGKRAEAEKALREADERFGGLAAPRSLALSQR